MCVCLGNGLPSWGAGAAVVPAILVTILLFMDQHITAIIVNRKDNKLKVARVVMEMRMDGHVVMEMRVDGRVVMEMRADGLVVMEMRVDGLIVMEMR